MMNESFHVSHAKAADAAVDWREKGAVTSVRP